MSAQDTSEISFVVKALGRGLITRAQLEEALAEQGAGAASSGKQARPIEDILVARGDLTAKQAASLKFDPARATLDDIVAPGTNPASDSGSTLDDIAASSPDQTLDDIPGAFRVTPAPKKPVASPPPPAMAKPLGKYGLLRLLGRGGTGVVYEALDIQLKRKVALKLTVQKAYVDLQQKKADEERFLREAQFSASLARHPNIVSVYEAGVIEGRRYIAMELILGKSMDIWRLQARLHVQVTLLRNVALAMDHAHQHGIMHRDLKPQNVLVDGYGQPHITDFGLAKALDQEAGMSLTGEGMLAGTPAYMSPEQARGLKTIDRRTDIYSMGVMLYEMLTGRAPFTGETPMEILMKVVKDPVVPPTKVLLARWEVEDVRALEDICLKALAKEPEQRYATAKMMAEDLTKWLKGEEVKVARPWGRRMWVGIAAAAVVLVGVVGAIAGLQGSGRLVQKDLETARQMMEEKRYAEALLAYGQTLARDGGNAEALEGQRAAQKKIEEDKQGAVQEAVKRFGNTGGGLWAGLDEGTSNPNRTPEPDPDRQRLDDERNTLEARVKAAEKAGREADEQLLQKKADRVAEEERRSKLSAEEGLVLEGRATALLGEVGRLVAAQEYGRAAAEARRLLAQYPYTEAARQSRDLVATIEAKGQEVARRRDEERMRDVIEKWKLKRQALISDCADLDTLYNARSQLTRIDAQLPGKIAQLVGATPDQVSKAWLRREPKERKASYGLGSWIALDGQDGGLDTDEKVGQTARFGIKKVALGQNLQTSQEWWESAGSAARKAWLEAEYASNSKYVTQVRVETKKCTNCQGAGTLNASRNQKTVPVKCPRCHGARMTEVSVEYW